MELSSKEKEKYLIIKKVIEGNISKKDAELKLELSRRQIDRLIIKYKNEGEKGFIHKNKGKANINKIAREIIEKLEEKYLTEYYDYNFEAFYEEIEDEFNISYTVMLQQFKRDDIISRIINLIEILINY